MPLPGFDRSLNTISTRGGQIMPTTIQLAPTPRIFRPPYGPAWHSNDFFEACKQSPLSITVKFQGRKRKGIQLLNCYCMYHVWVTDLCNVVVFINIYCQLRTCCYRLLDRNTVTIYIISKLTTIK